MLIDLHIKATNAKLNNPNLTNAELVNIYNNINKGPAIPDIPDIPDIGAPPNFGAGPTGANVVREVIYERREERQGQAEREAAMKKIDEHQAQFIAKMKQMGEQGRRRDEEMRKKQDEEIRKKQEEDRQSPIYTEGHPADPLDFQRELERREAENIKFYEERQKERERMAANIYADMGVPAGDGDIQRRMDERAKKNNEERAARENRLKEEEKAKRANQFSLDNLSELEISEVHKMDLREIGRQYSDVEISEFNLKAKIQEQFLKIIQETNNNLVNMKNYVVMKKISDQKRWYLSFYDIEKIITGKISKMSDLDDMLSLVSFVKKHKNTISYNVSSNIESQYKNLIEKEKRAQIPFDIQSLKLQGSYDEDPIEKIRINYQDFLDMKIDKSYLDSKIDFAISQSSFQWTKDVKNWRLYLQDYLSYRNFFKTIKDNFSTFVINHTLTERIVHMIRLIPELDLYSNYDSFRFKNAIDEIKNLLGPDMEYDIQNKLKELIEKSKQQDKFEEIAKQREDQARERAKREWREKVEKEKEDLERDRKRRQEKEREREEKEKKAEGESPCGICKKTYTNIGIYDKDQHTMGKNKNKWMLQNHPDKSKEVREIRRKIADLRSKLDSGLPGLNLDEIKNNIDLLEIQEKKFLDLVKYINNCWDKYQNDECQ